MCFHKLANSYRLIRQWGLLREAGANRTAPPKNMIKKTAVEKPCYNKLNQDKSTKLITSSKW